MKRSVQILYLQVLVYGVESSCMRHGKGVYYFRILMCIIFISHLAARGAHSNRPGFTAVYIYIYVSVLILLPLKVVKKKKKNKDSSHNLRLSASIIVFRSRKLTSFLSELFMPISRTLKALRPKEKVKS